VSMAARPTISRSRYRARGTGDGEGAPDGGELFVEVDQGADSGGRNVGDAGEIEAD